MKPLYEPAYAIISVVLSLLCARYLFLVVNRKFNRKFIIYGMTIFIVGITIHEFIALPVVLIFHGFGVLIPFGNVGIKNFATIEIIYYGLAAGIGQEIAKAIPLLFERKNKKNEDARIDDLGFLGMNVGLGFSLIEIIFVTFKHYGCPVSATGLLLFSFERISATLFHMATGGWIGKSIKENKLRKGLSICVAIHAVVDMLTGLINKYGLSFEGNLLFEISLFLFSLLFVIYVLKMNGLKLREKNASHSLE